MKAKGLFFILFSILGTHSLNAMKTLTQVEVVEECPVCMNNFTSTNPRVGLRNCIHALCQNCNDKVFDCPFCRQATVSRGEFTEIMDNAIARGDGTWERALWVQKDPRLNEIRADGMVFGLPLPVESVFYEKIIKGEAIPSCLLKQQSPEALKVAISTAMRKGDMQIIDVILQELFERRVKLEPNFWKRYSNDLRRTNRHLAEKWDEYSLWYNENLSNRD